MEKTDLAIVGGGLAGLVAAAEAADRGRRVVILDQEPEGFLGGQAFWSLGGLFMVDTPEQRRLRVRDSRDLAWQDWLGSAQFDRPEDAWPRRAAEAFVDFAAGEMRSWLRAQGMRWFPVVGWAERGGALADGHGNSVPRFHIVWGAGPGVLEPFERRVRAHAAAGRVRFLFRRRVDALETIDGAVTGVSGVILADSSAPRGAATSRDVVGDFRVDADAVLIASGGIGGNFELFSRWWPTEALGPAPKSLISGVPAHVDGRMLEIAEAAGASLINRDRYWCYTEGVRNWDPIWPAHGIRVLPGPSALWLDALGRRMEAPYLPGFDTRGTLRRILSAGYDYSWFILTQKIIEKEFALSGSEQNPDLTGKSWRQVLKRIGPGATPPVEAFKSRGPDFVVRDRLEDLVAGMNAVAESHPTPAPPLDVGDIRRQIEARDREIRNPFSKDAQVTAIRGARRYLGDRLIRTAPPHALLDPKAGPLIAVKLNIITRKTLGGLETDLAGRALDGTGAAIPGLYAAGEAAGFGGGGHHGYNALEGTFLGGCIFSGRNAGRAIADGA